MNDLSANARRVLEARYLARDDAGRVVESYEALCRRVARAVAANSEAVSVVGGGSTVEVVGALGLRDRMTHVSTGGGASLEFLEGRTLPGVAALQDR